MAHAILQKMTVSLRHATASTYLPPYLSFRAIAKESQLLAQAHFLGKILVVTQDLRFNEIVLLKGSYLLVNVLSKRQEIPAFAGIRLRQPPPQSHL